MTNKNVKITVFCHHFSVKNLKKMKILLCFVCFISSMQLDGIDCNIKVIRVADWIPIWENTGTGDEANLLAIGRQRFYLSACLCNFTAGHQNYVPRRGIISIYGDVI
jgi:hypothetical protein